MALKGDRHELDTDITFFMNETASAGQVVCISTAGSGAAMDNSSAVATVAAEASGNVALGILLNNVVNIDQTRQELNAHQDEVQQGGKVTILTKGFVVTDQISGTPTTGQSAYAADSGLISASQDGDSTLIGRFLSVKDGNGFAKVSVNLP